ncbi:16S rRNA (uracil(1498)-N(3))-methyltransferase [Candidatus Aminicenantes bacterium AC-335-A11]|jgi:16S rRNA (uracil1498-N3)-methyltransferase|nr:16S rRNA (uracil(1498)-N(3))-methyltransferase [SCandidatus Aminicenantes bacterium Aminicenantia_JdfR_composite]MCP2598017.1 16S rRNA (uracil(1498)-N(3))-methyltransferase [Candidatus Aminicenantes bacterium AC-335-L06]MCP2618799.1 16S rRNA (uracil(1498)-N(3))-methyltransferase [Candidatus Aminicenantes bacterium AC-335-A11]
MTANRFFIEKSQIHGKKAILRGREHHHLSNVLRMKENERVWLFDEDGKSYLGKIDEVKKKETIISILELREKEPSQIKVILAQALIKPSVMELIVQKSTELGIDEIIPVVSKRSRSLPEEEILNQRLKRWRRITIEALKQSGGVFIPKIVSPIKLNELSNYEVEKKLFLNEREGELLKNIVIDSLENIPKSVLVLIGPEGGWAKEEEKMLIDSGFQPVSLGEKILRSETAAICALGIIIHFWKH